MIKKFIRNVKDVSKGLDLEFRLRNSYGNTFDENKRKLYNESMTQKFRNVYPAEINGYALAIAYLLHPIKALSCMSLAAEDWKTTEFLKI